MKQFLEKLAAKWKLVILPAIIKLGFWGVLAVSILDSSTIPVPMDAVLAVYIWKDRNHFWAYVLAAAVGSALGGLLPYGIGRAGGELFLRRRVNRSRFDQLRSRFERQEFLAVMIPSMLPPPTPWKLFVFAAGVFRMRIMPYMLAIFSGRCLRWLLLALLVRRFGPGAVDLVARHTVPALVALVGSLALAAIIWLWTRRRAARRGPRSSGGDPSAPPPDARGDHA